MRRRVAKSLLVCVLVLAFVIVGLLDAIWLEIVATVAVFGLGMVTQTWGCYDDGPIDMGHLALRRTLMGPATV